jgi:hypothetical protein
MKHAARFQPKAAVRALDSNSIQRIAPRGNTRLDYPVPGRSIRWIVALGELQDAGKILVEFLRMSQSNLHFTVDDGWRLILLLDPASKGCGALLPLLPVNPFTDNMNQREHGKYDYENSQR